MAEVRFDGCLEELRAASPSFQARTSRSATTSSWCWSVLGVRQIDRGCAWWPGSRRSRRTITIGGRVGQRSAAQGRDICDGVSELRALPPHDRARRTSTRPAHRRKTTAAERSGWLPEARRSSTSPTSSTQAARALWRQRQRVAVGRRSSASRPFSSSTSRLQPRRKLRVQMRAEISKLQQRLQATTIYVTHDQVEAMTMGHRIVGMKDGRRQAGGEQPPSATTGRRNLFVASFIGTPPMNLFTATVRDGGGTLEAPASRCRCRRRYAPQRAGRERHQRDRRRAARERPRSGAMPARRVGASAGAGRESSSRSGTSGRARTDRHRRARRQDRPPRRPAHGEPLDLLPRGSTPLHLFDAASEARLVF